MSRVKKEVDIHNTKVEIPYSGLVIPDRVEKLLNGKRKNSDKSKVDFEKQSYIALDGFVKNQFFVIINDRQAEGLEEVIDIVSIREVEFIKLTQLVGG